MEQHRVGRVEFLGPCRRWGYRETCSAYLRMHRSLVEMDRIKKTTQAISDGFPNNMQKNTGKKATTKSKNKKERIKKKQMKKHKQKKAKQPKKKHK